MRRIHTILVTTGAESRCAVTVCDRFKTKRLNLSSKKTFLLQRGAYVEQILKLTKIPHDWWAFYWRQIVHIATTLLVSRNRRKQPRLVIFTDDHWKDAPNDRPLEQILPRLFEDRRWKTFALRQGIVTCVLSHDDDTLGLDGRSSRSRKLLNLGIDLIFDDRARGGDALANEVLRCFDLLVRHDRWTVQSRFVAWLDAIIAFCLLGFCLEEMKLLVGWIAERNTFLRSLGTIALSAAAFALTAMVSAFRRSRRDERFAALIKRGP